MRLVRYGDGRAFETTDAIADALLDCVWAFADSARSAVVQVPVRGEDGAFADLGLLLGVGETLTVEAVEPRREDPPAPELEGRLAGIRAAAATAAATRFRR